MKKLFLTIVLCLVIFSTREKSTQIKPYPYLIWNNGSIEAGTGFLKFSREKRREMIDSVYRIEMNGADNQISNNAKKIWNSI